MAEKQKATGLIVDDDALMRDMYATKFKEAGLTLNVAQSVDEALAFLEQKENEGLDFLLLDLAMPNVNGFQCLEQIRSRGLCKNTLIVVFSNLGDPDDIERAKTFNVDDYIVKANFTPSEVVEKVTALLDERKS